MKGGVVRDEATTQEGHEDLKRELKVSVIFISKPPDLTLEDLKRELKVPVKTAVGCTTLSITLEDLKRELKVSLKGNEHAIRTTVTGGSQKRIEGW